ncbi:MAG: phage portal protein [Planctomycetota bacterium]
MVSKTPYHGQKAVTNPERYTESVIVPTDGMGHYGAKPWPFDYRRAVDHFSGWVYRCVMGNANAAAAVPLRLYVRKRSKLQLKAAGLGAPAFESRRVSVKRMKYLRGEFYDHQPSAFVRNKLAEFGDEFEEVADHPALTLLRTVNPMFNGFDLATFRHTSNQLTGQNYLHPVMSSSLMRPTELWPMPPHWTRIVPADPGSEEVIKGYVFGDGYTREHEFAPDEVLHSAINRGVRDLHYGYGPMEAAWSTIGLSYSKRISDKALFDNMARPDYVLSIEGAGSEEAQRTESRISAMHRGVRRVGKALVTTGKARVQTLQFPPKDVGEFRQILEELAGIFGYPIQKLQAAYEPKANAETADYGWMKDTILPMLRQDEESLNQGGYLALFGDGALLDDVVLAYDDPVPANAESERNDTQVYVVTGVTTINEERAERGLPPVDGGDVPRINGVSIEALDEQARAQAEAMAQPFGSIVSPGGSPALPAASETTPSEPEAAKPAVSLNGAQIQAAQGIVSDVADNKIPRGAAIELLSAVGVPRETARIMIEEAESFTPQTVEDAAKAKSLAIAKSLAYPMTRTKAASVPRENHPALTAALTDTYDDTDDALPWLGWMEPDDGEWIGFLAEDGWLVVFDERAEDGGVLGKPWALMRYNLVESEAYRGQADVKRDNRPEDQFRGQRKAVELSESDRARDRFGGVLSGHQDKQPETCAQSGRRGGVHEDGARRKLRAVHIGQPQQEFVAGPQTKAMNLTKRMRELHKASCVMLTVNGDASDLAYGFQNSIEHDELTGDGLEHEHHVTIKWGLKTDAFELVAVPLRMAQPVRVRLGKTAIFEADEHDVVYVAVESDQLVALHAALGEFDNDEPDRPYIPHMTLAYVEKGKGEQYAGRDDFDGLEAILHTVVFSASNGDASTMTLRSSRTGDGDGSKHVGLGDGDGGGIDKESSERGDCDRGKAADSPAKQSTDDRHDKAGNGEACVDCKSYDHAEGDVEGDVKKYGPDAAYMPVGFKGYTKAKSDPETGEATGEADNTIRDGEPETPIQRMGRLMADAFREQERAVLSAIKSTKGKRVKVKADATDAEKLEAARNDPRIAAVLDAIKADPIQQAIEDGLPPMVAAGAESGAGQIGMTAQATGDAGGDAAGLTVSFDVSNPLVEREARRRAIDLAGDLNQTTVNRLRDSLADGIAAGESPAKLTARVREQFASFSDHRSEMIARTESALAYERGQQAAWRDSGVVAGKKWLLAPGACEFCEAIAAVYAEKSIGLGDNFVEKDANIRGTRGGTMKANYRALDGPPVHPSCRCDLIPVLGDDYADLTKALEKNDRDAIQKFWTHRRRRQPTPEPGQTDRRDKSRPGPGGGGTAGVPGPG